MDLYSTKVPKPTWSVNDHMDDLFGFFTFNWAHIVPAVIVVCGIAFGFFVLRGLKDKFM